MGKPMLAVIGASALLGFLATASKIEAYPRAVLALEQVSHRHYHVFCRPDNRHPWKLYGTYRSHPEAHDTAQHLRDQGYEARVSHNR